METIQYDEPIETSDQDLLSRGPLVELCAKTLSSTIRNGRSFVIGLSGPWGSGKTSFLNLLDERLRSDKRPPTIVKFNPWLYDSREQLLRDFFSEVISAIGVEKDGKLGKAITEYSDALTEVGTFAIGQIPPIAALNTILPIANGIEKTIINKLIKKVGNHLSPKEKTLAQSRADLSKELAKLDKGIVVVMDDVDRLSSEEIRILFKFVTLVASFPRVTYVLSYDFEVVCSALEYVQGISGRQYLEKIVQLPIELPPASHEVIDAQLRASLQPYIDSISTHSLVGMERTRLARIYRTIVLHNISTVREVKRFVNKAYSNASFLGEEICPTDLLGMTALELSRPHIHQWIWKNRDELCGERYHAKEGDKSWVEGLLDSFNQAAGLDNTDAHDAFDAIALLYPEVTRWQNSSPTFVNKGILRTSGRVANIHNTELYYGVIDLKGITRTLMNGLVVSTDGSTLRTYMLRFDKAGELGAFLEYIKSKFDALPTQRNELIATQLLLIVGEINQSQDVPIFEFPLPIQFAETIGAILQKLGISKADEILEKAAIEYGWKGYVGITWFLRDERLRQQVESPSESRISKPAYELLSSRYVECITRNLPRILCMQDHPAKHFWRVLDEDAGLGYLEKIRSRFSTDYKLRCLSAASELKRWVGIYGDLQDGYEADSNRHHNPLFGNVSCREIEMFVSSSMYAALHDDMKTRVAALYLLTYSRQTCDDGEEARNRITTDEAVHQVRCWEKDINENRIEQKDVF